LTPVEPDQPDGVAEDPNVLFATRLWSAICTCPLELMNVAVPTAPEVVKGLLSKVKRESREDIWVKSRDSVEPSLASSAG
jgi:hypothetical protein